MLLFFSDFFYGRYYFINYSQFSLKQPPLVQKKSGRLRKTFKTKKCIDCEAKRLFTKWSLKRVVVKRELTVVCIHLTMKTVL